MRQLATLRERRLADHLHAVGKGIALLIGRGAEQKHLPISGKQAAILRLIMLVLPAH